jgi:hypothetical protein
MRNHMAETVHGFLIVTAGKYSKPDLVTNSDARDAFNQYLIGRHISHYEKCHSTLKKMVDLRWNFISCMDWFREVWILYFQKSQGPGKLNPEWINFPEEIVKEMGTIFKKYFRKSDMMLTLPSSSSGSAASTKQDSAKNSAKNSAKKNSTSSGSKSAASPATKVEASTGGTKKISTKKSTKGK